ncbi:MAG TPA: hypothetical protein VJ813_16090 [Vicinamibacterales bacterium]|nr:hypothetical protein [Vicinamibacterales bacterium]
MLKTTIVPALLATAALTAGCLQKDAVHTLYLSPDGAVRWVVDESTVYSDEADEGKRVAEEQAFIGPALIGTHTAARALQALAADGLVRTTVVRDERPFHVITETRFSRVERALERLFTEAGVKASARLEQDGRRSTLRIRLDFAKDPEERASPVVKMLEDVDDLRFVLTDGRFVAGGGFDMPDRLTATVSRAWMAAAEKAIEAKRAIELALTWEAGA